MTFSDFDDIRPYTDAELPPALDRIASWELFPQLVRYIYPDLPIDQAQSRLRAITSVHQLQATFMNDAIKRILASTSSNFSFSGLNRLRRGESYLFISNHRDITLDAFILQHLLLEHKAETSYIVFGNNLLSSQVIADLFACNKLIRMERGGSPRAYYRSLQHLSAFINELIVDQHQSVWIAQRNGRNKDGIDATSPALLKMLTLGSNDSPLQTLTRLHIVPISISYEWDPCDLMKTRELALSRHANYIKSPDEDFNSVVTGIIAPKGSIHLAIGQPLTASSLQPPIGIELTHHVASLIDHQIQRNYHLMPTNYLAFDRLFNTSRFRRHYSAAIINEFDRRLSQLPDAEQRQIFIEMYANPIVMSRRTSSR